MIIATFLDDISCHGDLKNIKMQLWFDDVASTLHYGG